MARFLANITELTRLESGQINPRLSPVQLAEAVDAAIAPAGTARRMSRCACRSRRSRCWPIPRCWSMVLRQRAGERGEIRARRQPDPGARRRRGGEVALTVADEGIGIPPDDLPHVFDSFFRAQRGDRVAPGTGLGLAIARGMVEAMGGRDRARSARVPTCRHDGAPGTVITMRLPAATLVVADEVAAA